MLAYIDKIKDQFKQLFKKKGSSVNIDNSAFRCHYKLTVLALFLYCLLITENEYVKEHIRCVTSEITKDQKLHKMADKYCYRLGTFTVDKHNTKNISNREVSHPGVGPAVEFDEISRHSYYQWVPYVVMFQAICFYAPHFLWKLLEGGRMKLIADGFSKAFKLISNEQNKKKEVASIGNKKRAIKLNYMKTKLMSFHENDELKSEIRDKLQSAVDLLEYTVPCWNTVTDKDKMNKLQQLIQDIIDGMEKVPDEMMKQSLEDFKAILVTYHEEVVKEEEMGKLECAFETQMKGFKEVLDSNKNWALYLFACELLNLVNLILQIWLNEVFLDGEFLSLASKAFEGYNNDTFDPLEVIFPKVTKCDFLKYGKTGTIQHHDIMCIMGHNLYNEKIYLFFWFAYLALFIVTILSILYRIVSRLSYSEVEYRMKFFKAPRFVKLEDSDDLGEKEKEAVHARNEELKMERENNLRRVLGTLSFREWVFFYYLHGNMSKTQEKIEQFDKILSYMAQGKEQTYLSDNTVSTKKELYPLLSSL